MTKIRILDIPPEGKDIEFDLPKGELNERLLSSALSAGASSRESVTHVLQNSPQVKLHLDLESGSTVLAKGSVQAKYKSPCARCAEDTEKSIVVPIDIVLKHASAKNRHGAEEEDLHLSYYEGNEIDCDEFTSDLLFLGMPYVVLCSETCKGLCPSCGTNLNLESCNCAPEVIGDPRLNVLRQLKLSH